MIRLTHIIKGMILNSDLPRVGSRAYIIYISMDNQYMGVRVKTYYFSTKNVTEDYMTEIHKTYSIASKEFTWKII